MTCATEQWLVFPDCSELEISDQGKVRTATTQEIVAVRHPPGHYPSFNWNGHSFKLHIVVATTWHGRRPSPLHHCCHFDDDPLNNTASNLRWDYPEGNSADRVRNIGLANEPINEEQVARIIDHLQKGKVAGVVAKAEGVSVSTVYRIRRKAFVRVHPEIAWAAALLREVHSVTYQDFANLIGIDAGSLAYQADAERRGRKGKRRCAYVATTAGAKNKNARCLKNADVFWSATGDWLCLNHFLQLHGVPAPRPTPETADDAWLDPNWCLTAAQHVVEKTGILQNNLKVLQHNKELPNAV